MTYRRCKAAPAPKGKERAVVNLKVQRIRENLRSTALAHDLGNYRDALEMNRGLLRDTTRKLHEAREEIARAKRIAGAMSVLWSEPKKIEHGGRPGDRVDVESAPSFDPLAPIGPVSDTMTFTRMPLDMVLTRVRQDVLERTVHARVEFLGGEVGYGLTEDALRALVRSGDLEDQVVRTIAPQMARLLLEKAVQWYRGGRR